MKYKDKRNMWGFTLIELISVLVILAIMALIVTPLVMNIISKTKASANKRSIDAYGKAVELAASNYLLETGKKASSFDILNVEYSGNKVNCEVREVYKNNVFLSKCKVGNSLVKDSNTSDGYYHYKTGSEFINEYGKLIEKEVRKYKKQNGELPNSIFDLEVNKSGLNVNCARTKINSDQSVYLSECSLGDVTLSDKNNKDGYYHYGEAAYLVGDIVTYNGIDFYVIEKADDTNDTVHLLKAEAIKQGEIKDYLSSTEIEEYIDIYASGANLGMQYLYSDTCVSMGGESNTGCSTDYSISSVKQIVDVWSQVYLRDEDLVEDNKGYKVRLLTLDDLLDEMGFYVSQLTPSNIGYKTEFRYFDNIRTWTMIPGENGSDSISLLSAGVVSQTKLWDYNLVNPVINIKTSSLLKEAK